MMSEGQLHHKNRHQGHCLIDHPQGKLILFQLNGPLVDFTIKVKRKMKG